MINSVSPIGVYNQNYQMTFRAKGEKAAYEVVDQLHQAAKEITRSAEEKRETLRSKSLQWLKDLKFECPYIGKKVNPNETTIEQINEAHRQEYLQRLAKEDPQLYQEIMMKEAMTMSHWEMLKDIAKAMFKKS